MLLDMDIDAFYEEQDQHMNEPEDDADEFLARMSRTRKYIPLTHLGFKWANGTHFPSQFSRRLP